MMFINEHHTVGIEMAKIIKYIDPDVHFRVLNALEENPYITQRELAQKLGISLGRINYCLKALAKIGHLKINNFKKNSNKSDYLYLLTPTGISNKALLATDFLKRKIKEYEILKAEIESLKRSIMFNDKI